MNREPAVDQQTQSLPVTDESFRSLFVEHPVPGWIYDRETLRVLEVNNAALRRYGRTRDEFLRLTHDGIRGSVDNNDSPKIPSMGESVTCEERHRLKDGRGIDVRMTSRVVTFCGRPAVFTTGEDISGQKPDEENVRQNDRNLRTILDNVAAFVGLFTADGRFVFANRPALEMAGLNLEDVLGKHVADTFFSQHSEVSRDWIRDAMSRCASGESVTGEFTVQTAAPAVMEISAIFVPMRDASRNIVQLIGLGFDITERKRSEETLRLALEWLDDAQAHAHIGSWSYDPKIEKGEWSAELYRLWDVDSSDDALAFPQLLERVHPDDRNAFVRHNELDLIELRGRELEYRVVRPDGSIRWLSGKSNVVLDEARNVARRWGTAQDITERKLREEGLSEAQERLRQAVIAGDVGLWDWDMRTNEVCYSAEWKRQIGYEDDEIPGHFEEWRSRIHEEDLDATLKAVSAYCANPSGPYQAKFRLRHKNGTYRHILAHGSIVLDGDGNPYRFLGSHADITEQTELQFRLQQIQKIESVGRLAGGIAHDFNNLLTVIIGSSEILLGLVKEGDRRREHVERILQTGERAAALTRQLLAFSRQQVMKLEPVNLNEIVADIGDLITRVIGEDIKIVVAPAEDLGNVMADAGQIEQVVVNLAVNARDAMPNGGTLTIETGNVELSETFAAEHPSVRPGPHVMLSVSDTGTGMDEGTRGRVFEPFFTTKEVGKGTGLGLSTVYGIVKQTNGSIWVYSEPGRGTTFKIYLPRTDTAASKFEPAPAAAAMHSSDETILVVEDDDMIRPLATLMLESEGYKVLTAMNGLDALSLLGRQGEKIHLLFTDLVMPGMTGLDLATRVRGRRPEMKVLFTSGYSEHAVLQHGVPGGPGKFIAKPYSPTQLRHKVRQVLNSRESDPATE